MKRAPNLPLAKGKLIDLMREDLARTSIPDIILDAERIGPTPERLLRSMDDDGTPSITEVELGDRRDNWRAYRLDDAPLGRLFRRKRPLITQDQFNAGESYYAVVYFAGMLPGGAPDPSRVIVDGGQHKHIPDRLIAAKARYEHIIKKMPHVSHHIVDNIVVQEVPLAEYAERFRKLSERRVRQAVALDRLQVGLDWLVEHFDLGRRPHRSHAIVGERPIIMPSTPATPGSGSV